MAENNQTRDWNKPSQNKEKYTKNQQNSEMIFEKINMINESLAQLTKWNRNSIYIIKIKIEMWDIIAEREEIQKLSHPSTSIYTEPNWKM